MALHGRPGFRSPTNSFSVLEVRSWGEGYPQLTAIEALTHTAVLHHKMVSEEATEALVEATTRSVVGYLTG
jgi:hypothetical protein